MAASIRTLVIAVMVAVLSTGQTVVASATGSRDYTGVYLIEASTVRLTCKVPGGGVRTLPLPTEAWMFAVRDGKSLSPAKGIVKDSGKGSMRFSPGTGVVYSGPVEYQLGKSPVRGVYPVSLTGSLQLEAASAPGCAGTYALKGRRLSVKSEFDRWLSRIKQKLELKWTPPAAAVRG